MRVPVFSRCVFSGEKFASHLSAVVEMDSHLSKHTHSDNNPTAPAHHLNPRSVLCLSTTMLSAARLLTRRLPSAPAMAVHTRSMGTSQSFVSDFFYATSEWGFGGERIYSHVVLAPSRRDADHATHDHHSGTRKRGRNLVSPRRVDRWKQS